MRVVNVCFNSTTAREGHMRRREFITLISGAATWLRTVRGMAA
jgi:hypothetical protein